MLTINLLSKLSILSFAGVLFVSLTHSSWAMEEEDKKSHTPSQLKDDSILESRIWKGVIVGCGKNTPAYATKGNLTHTHKDYLTVDTREEMKPDILGNFDDPRIVKTVMRLTEGRCVPYVHMEYPEKFSGLNPYKNAYDILQTGGHLKVCLDAPTVDSKTCFARMKEAGFRNVIAHCFKHPENNKEEPYWDGEK